jgi:hypothetical protein
MAKWWENQLPIPTEQPEHWVTVGVLDQQPTKGVPEVDECGLVEIGNSKVETRGTQVRQVRPARCVIVYVLCAA